MENNKGGRPLKFNSVEELQSKIDSYFAWAEEHRKPLTIERLAVFLYVDRDTILNYEKKDEYFGTIKKAKSYICLLYTSDAADES